MLMLCSLQYIHSNTLFLTVAVGARILQGAGSSLMITICFALAALAYPLRIEIFHTLLQMCATLGFAMSPLTGSFFY